MNLPLKIAREIGQREAEAHTLFNLGLVLGPQGEYARTLEMAQEGLSIAEQIEHRQWLTYGHWELGALYLDLFDLPTAQQHLEQALALAHEIGSEYWIHMASGVLALVYIAQQDVTRAESILSAAPGSGAPTQTAGQAIAWYARAELAQVLGDPGLALEIIDQLIASTRNPSRGQRIPRLSKVRGEALAALQRGAEAEAALRAAQEDAHAKGLKKVCNIHKGEHLMSTEDNKAIARRFIGEGWNQGNVTAFDELCTPNWIYHDPAQPQIHTLEDYKQVVTEGRRVYPDIHLTIEDMIVEGDQVALRYTFRGTNTGDFVTPSMPMPIPATGKQVTISGISINRIAEGKAIETWNQADNLGALQQLGLIPAPGQAS